jgi:predicted NAD-dependent protein-ADP-ribosyltransferase YbiA (DUF1768 family)
MIPIYFYSGKTAYRSLSNFWEHAVIIEDREYETGEHCFHGEKYYRLGQLSTDPIRAHKLLEYSKYFKNQSPFSSPSIAKQKGGKKGLLLTTDELNHWTITSIDVQRNICKYKFDHYQEVRDDLIQSKQNTLIHPALRKSDEYVIKNSIWEGRYKSDGSVIGQNKLGNIWMNLRNIK